MVLSPEAMGHGREDEAQHGGILGACLMVLAFFSCCPAFEAPENLERTVMESGIATGSGAEGY